MNNSAEWSIKFDDADFDTFVFASGDKTTWLEIKKAELITGAFYACTNTRNVMRKFDSTTPTRARICFTDITSSPTIYLKRVGGENAAAGEAIVYAGAGGTANALVSTKGGADVYINKNPRPDFSEWLQVRHLPASIIT